MIVIGERINATRKSIAAALKARDSDTLIKTALQQAQAGADYLDINGGDPNQQKEVENVAYLLDLVQANTDLPAAVDTASAEAMKTGLKMAKKTPILNSISREAGRLESMLPIAAEYDCMVIALLMSDAGPPAGVDDRLKNAEFLIHQLSKVGKKLDEIIVDPCFLPISTDTSAARNVIEAISMIRREWPEVHIGGGCSNISFGLPKRRWINFALLSQAIYHGMDVGIIDPCIPGIMATIAAAETVAGKDEFCMNYVTAEREGKLG